MPFRQIARPQSVRTHHQLKILLRLYQISLKENSHKQCVFKVKDPRSRVSLSNRNQHSQNNIILLKAFYKSAILVKRVKFCLFIVKIV